MYKSQSLEKITQRSQKIKITFHALLGFFQNFSKSQSLHRGEAQNFSKSQRLYREPNIWGKSSRFFQVPRSLYKGKAVHSGSHLTHFFIFPTFSFIFPTYSFIFPYIPSFFLHISRTFLPNYFPHTPSYSHIFLQIFLIFVGSQFRSLYRGRDLGIFFKSQSA